MAYTFVKLLKWLVSISFFIMGIYFLRMAAEDDSIRPVFLVIFSFGVVYWMSKATYEASKKTFLIGLGIVLFMGMVARFLVWPYLLTADIIIDYYMTWELTSVVVGIPIMSYFFWKEG